ncbi:aldehyde dehydrogenase family protein [Escherichia coli]|nr:aldehyde dehydrogenase family protein [Escherichia coli]
MNFHHLAYWQDKALSLAIETRLFINGEYTAAAENETFETVDPVTQAPLAKIARGKSVDIDRAVSAARSVFERGDWSQAAPAKRKAVLNKLADLMEAHADSVHSFIREGESKGQLLLDGRNAGLAAAIGPTIFVDVDPNASLSREEIFGPVLVVTRFTSEEQALQLANDSQYGLGAAVWTRDLSRAHRMSRRLKAGSVFVNNYNDGDMTVPFGGYKQSGNGRDKSLHALEKFTELKTIWISLEA